MLIMTKTVNLANTINSKGQQIEGYSAQKYKFLVMTFLTSTWAKRLGDGFKCPVFLESRTKNNQYTPFLPNSDFRGT